SPAHHDLSQATATVVEMAEFLVTVGEQPGDQAAFAQFEAVLGARRILDGQVAVVIGLEADDKSPEAGGLNKPPQIEGVCDALAIALIANKATVCGIRKGRCACRRLCGCDAPPLVVLEGMPFAGSLDAGLFEIPGADLPSHESSSLAVTLLDNVPRP